MLTIIHLIIIFLTPLLSYWIVKKVESNLLSPVVICYAVGIGLRNLSTFPVNESLTQSIYEASIVLAIPLLLFSTNLIQSIRYAKKGLLAFFSSVVISIITLIIVAFFYNQSIPAIWVVGGMLAGIFTGGTPNGNAIAIALDAPSEVVTLVNGADTLIGAPYLLFLTSLAPILYGLWLPAFSGNKIEEENTLLDQKDKLVFPDTLYGLGLAILILLCSAGLTFLVFGSLSNDTIIILLLTTLSLGATFLPKVSQWKGTFLLGEYLLLVFCVALGMNADLVTIIEQGLSVVAYYCATFFPIVIIHSLVARFLKIDRDTYLISFTAAFFGPVFIGQIASTLNNRNLIVMGMALSILGLAIGNYIGLGVAYLIELGVGN